MPRTTEQGDDKIHFTIISTTIFVVAFFGIIGNVHVIWAVKRFPDLRTKNGVLLCFLACHHCICLAYETLSAVRLRIGPTMTRRQCYSSIFVYTYCINHQSCLVLALVCDIAFCMLRPLKYHCTPVFPYVHLMQIPCYIFSFSFLVIGFITMNDDNIMACNPPLAYDEPVMDAWNVCYLTVNVATVSSRAYCLLWRSQTTLIFENFSPITRGTAQNCQVSLSPSGLILLYVVIPSIFTYAQTYYIYFIVCRDYRNAFKKIGIFGFNPRGADQK